MFLLQVVQAQYVPMYEYEEEVFEGEQCHYRSYGDRSKIMFQARSYFATDREAGYNAFEVVVDELYRISERRSLNQAGCDRDLKTFPCYFLTIDRNEDACQLAQRIHHLYQYISAKCSADWTNRMQPFVTRMMSASQPKTGDCHPLGLPLVASAIRTMNEMFHAEHGVKLKDMLTEGTSEYRNRLTAVKEDIKKYVHATDKDYTFDPSAQMQQDFAFILPFDGNFTSYQNSMINRQLDMVDASIDMADSQFGSPNGGSWQSLATVRPVHSHIKLLIDTVAPTAPPHPTEEFTTATAVTWTIPTSATTPTRSTTTEVTTSTTVTTAPTVITTTTTTTAPTPSTKICPTLPDNDNWECTNAIFTKNTKCKYQCDNETFKRTCKCKQELLYKLKFRRN